MAAGVSDHLAQDEAHALSIARDIIAHLSTPFLDSQPPGLPAGGGGGGSSSSWDEPLFPPEELRAMVPSDMRRGPPLNMRNVLARLLDGSRFDEFKLNYGPTLVTGGWALGCASAPVRGGE